MAIAEITKLSAGLVSSGDRARAEEVLAELAADDRIPKDFVAQITAQFRALADGRDLLLLESGAEYSTTKVAEILGCSRPHLVKLCDRNEIGFHFVGTERRFRAADISEFLEQREQNRRRSAALVKARDDRQDALVASAAGMSVERARELGL